MNIMMLIIISCIAFSLDAMQAATKDNVQVSHNQQQLFCDACKAVEANEIEKAQELVIANPALLFCCDAQRRTLLHISIEKRCTAFSLWLITLPNCTLYALDDQQRSPLALACTVKEIAVVSELNKMGVTFDILVKKAQVKNSSRAEMLFCKSTQDVDNNSHQDAIEKEEWDQRALNSKYSKRLFSLLQQVGELASLLKIPGLVNVANEEQQTPLHWAVEHGSPKVVLQLLDSNSDIKAFDRYGMQPLHRAVLRGNKKIVQILLERGADITEPYSYQEELLVMEKIGTPLHLAAERGKRGRLLSSEEIPSVDLCKLLITESIFFPEAGVIDGIDHSNIVFFGMNLDDKAKATNLFYWGRRDIASESVGSTPYRKTIAVLWGLKQLKSMYALSTDLYYLIFTASSEICENIFLAMLPRIKRGIRGNCLADHVMGMPLALRPLAIEKIYRSMIFGLQVLVEIISKEELTSEMISLLDAATLEKNFGCAIRKNIRLRLGF